MYDIPCCVLPMVCLKPSKRCRGPFFPVSAFHFLHQRIIVAESTANSVGPRLQQQAGVEKTSAICGVCFTKLDVTGSYSL